MSENNQPAYDFNFICRALNLIPWRDGAINATAITNVRLGTSGDVLITLYGGEELHLYEKDVAELEATIKQRLKESAEMRAEEIRREAELRVNSEIEAANQAMANAAIMGKLQRMKPHS